MNPTKLIATALFAASLSAAAVAQDTSAPALNPRAMNRVEHRLNITPQQRKQARAILLQEQPKLQQMHLSLAAERKEMASASASGTFDSAAAQAVAARYAEANAAAVVERAKLASELIAILTPEQKQKLQQLRARIATVLGSQLPGLGDSL